MDAADYLALAAILVPTLLSLFVYARGASKTALKAAVATEGRLKAIEVKVDLFWKIIERDVPGMIHSPHNPDLDSLLDKWQDKSISPEETVRLRDRLREGLKAKGNDAIGKLLLLAVVEERIQRLTQQG